MGRKSGLVVSELDSQSKSCGFESRLIQILDGNGLKAMPGSGKSYKLHVTIYMLHVESEKVQVKNYK